MFDVGDVQGVKILFSMMVVAQESRVWNPWNGGVTRWIEHWTTGHNIQGWIHIQIWERIVIHSCLHMAAIGVIEGEVQSNMCTYAIDCVVDTAGVIASIVVN